MIKNKLYVIGGRDSGGANYPEFFDLTEERVDYFSFSSNSWSTLSENLPRPRAGAPVVVYKGSALVAGGEGDGRAWNEVDVLSGTKFKEGPSMPHPRHGFGLYSCNDALWAAGGAGVQGGGASQTMLDVYYSGERPKPCSSNSIIEGKKLYSTYILFRTSSCQGSISDFLYFIPLIITDR